MQQNLLRRFKILLVTIFSLLIFSASVHADTFNLPGLQDTVTVYEDALGVPTIVGSNELDVAFVQGYVHARDRFFQMDFNRKLASGRLAELLGQAALSNDIQLRTLGLSRAALVTYQAMDAETKGVLQSYSNGVNAWLRQGSLPPEYAALELTSATPWTAVDSVIIGKALAFQLSFDLDIDFTITLGAYQAAGQAAGFDGTALFFFDTHRSAPPDGRVTVPDFLSSIGGVGAPQAKPGKDFAGTQAAPGTAKAAVLDPKMLNLAQRYRDKVKDIPLIGPALKTRDGRAGSNWWIIGGEHTGSGYPMLANDPHLSLDTPSVFAEGHLIYKTADDVWEVSGVTVPGAPGVIQGCNSYLCWGSTVHPMDVTDTFQEQVITNIFGLPTHTMHNGLAEPIKAVFQSYFVNAVGDGEADNVARANVPYDAGGISFVIPRRNNGPILDIDGNTALSVAYTGWGPTFELRAFRMINQARSMEDFKSALQYFDFGSQNFGYADIDGNIAYFAGAENPIRADLQAGAPGGGIPPWIIRDGTGALNHDWLPVQNPQPNQALPFEIMPFAEMPQVVNPASGYIANANNDPIGTTLDNNPLNQLRPDGGIYYLNPGYAAYRMGRIDRVIQDWIATDKPLNRTDMKDLQANADLLDAELLMAAMSSGSVLFDPVPGSTLEQALNVLGTWDFSTPTGLAEGYDAGDDPMVAVEPDMTEIRNSAAATIFAVWRSVLIKNTIDKTLTQVGLGDFLPSGREAYNALAFHIQNAATNGGFGGSGLNFFGATSPEDAPIAFAGVMYDSLNEALDLLASDEFAPAFGNSTDVLDYRWGKLHRIVLDHPLGVDPFNVPNGGGFFSLSPELPGLPRQGGYQIPDASTHNPRALTVNGFMFGSGPARRFVGTMAPSGIIGEEVIPGGQSGVFLHPNYASQLPMWLTNQYHPLKLTEADALGSQVVKHTFAPPGG